MGYQALLFCPDERTARTVTQVLSELEFSVEACTEPFAVVKKLMGEHFDAMVVDCDNEQNATLLFKSARNSTSNQASLAVAVVEGQAGVAKAFRIGANLVLTKPINVEQAKGTLRVARGLLRKGDPAKVPTTTTLAPSQSSAPSANIPASPRPSPVPVSSTPRSASLNQPPKPSSTPLAPPTVAAFNPASVMDDDDKVIEMNERPVPAAPKPGASSPSVLAAPAPATRSTKDANFSSSSTSGAGFGSAAAPARSLQRSSLEKGTAPNVVTATEPLFDKPVASSIAESSMPIAVPNFSFGGADSAEITGGSGSKKAIIGAVAAVVVAAGLYIGWTRFHGKSRPSEAVPETLTTPPAIAVPKVPTASQPAKTAVEVAAPSSSLPQELASQPSPEKSADMHVGESPVRTPEKPASGKGTAKTSAINPASSAKSSSDTKPAPQPLVVKNGAAIAATHEPSASSDTAAPSVLGIAPSSSDGSISNLLGNPADASKPVLQTLNVSQGVSQGLLIKKAQPIYPPAAIRMHVEGSVQLLATIAKTGNITAVKILSGEPVLAQSALEAVKQWKYKPYYLNGDPVEIQTQVTVNFKLPR